MSGIYVSQELRRLRETAGQVANSVAAPQAAAVDEQRIWPEKSLRALGEAGLLALHVPEDLGGHGQGMLALALLTETLGQACSSTALCYGMHCVGTAAIAAKPTDYHRERYLAPIAAGKHLTTLSLSEPGSGAHFYLPSTEMHIDDEAFRVRGTKHFVTNGGHADSYVVSTVASDAALGEFSCLLVDADTQGLRWEGEWNGLGMRGNTAITMQMDDAQVPRRNLLGEEGDQVWYVFEIIAPYFLVAMAGTYLGIAQAALDYAIQHLRTRIVSLNGEPLATADVLQHRVGQLWSRVEAARQLLYSAAHAGDTGSPTALHSIFSCKAEVSDVAVQVVNEAMTLCGGLAYRENDLLARLLRDVRASHVMAPTTDMLRIWTGRALLGQSLI
ncbi:MAG TPA: acyl-CoA dehydrogenase family protein [Thermoanaerobaculia bacterium]